MVAGAAEQAYLRADWPNRPAPLTGARGAPRAEAVFQLRALTDYADFDAYWRSHSVKEAEPEQS